MSTLRVNAIVDASGGNTATINTYMPPAPVRAWVNFNGTGTVAIRASYNVSSITDNGTGAYAVNLTTAMPDTNYAINGAAGSSGAASGCWFTTGFNVNSYNTNNTTTSFRVQIYFASSNVADVDFIYAAIFR
jgi:hypothetical protein